MTQVGFVGTGAMGTAMIDRLLECGHRVVVHNRTKANAQTSLDAGGCWAESLEEVASSCSLVFSCLRDTRAVEDTYLGPGGLLDHASAGSTFVEHGTFDPSLAEQVSTIAKKSSCEFLDVPVTGGPAGAMAGSLTGMAGGNLDALAVVDPVMRSYLGSIHHVGTSGRGLHLKLVNQLLVTTHMAAAAEAAALLRKLKMPMEESLSVLSSGWASSTMLVRGLTQLADNDTTDTGVTIQGMIEVQSVIAAMLRGQHLDPHTYKAARGRFDHAKDAGYELRDPAAMVELVAES
ncbi:MULTISPECIES: NAD(P)-dependent oxidoreductase [Nocardiaceae]|uniref:NAD(P)-dependent oxidoreductase n=1 Tax=Nocardiaceae TaxID=85025 RepID=UPI00068E2BB6|nr:MULTISPECIES: NAD(P)-dependent oxidoreductase [Rhodococcus]OZF00762.1 NAD(P)-dependent oxidoreductase [Rhodococcus sp. 15-1189-1-1a]OZF21183.1 NAD(P)-dependent oxidoreductase [Rhodococcus sp. 14-2686-1-2]